MPLTVTTDPDEIVALVEPLLAADPVRNTVISSVIAGLRGEDAAGWCAHRSGDASVLAVRSQRHTPVHVSAGWDDLAPLADALAALASMTAVGGPVLAVQSLVSALEARGLVVAARIAERLFRLDDLAAPADVPGAPRLASLEDLTLYTDWYEAFLMEAFGRLPDGFDRARLVEPGGLRSRAWLWIDGTGAACSMAVRQPAAFGVSRIGPVYTPPELRGRGYGAAATAAATRDVLGDGAVPVLYTDLANATSNKIYQRLGYYPVEDRAHVAFS